MRAKAPWTTMPQYAKPAPVKQPKRIKARTTKRAKDEREYRQLSAIWWKSPDNEFCFACRAINDGNPEPATELHHWAGRRGELLNFIPYWKAACHDCHDFIHRYPAKAIALNLRAPNHLWNRKPQPKIT